MCPVRCSMHAAASHWLERGDVPALLAKRNILRTVQRHAWKGCTCGLWQKVEEVLRAHGA